MEDDKATSETKPVALITGASSGLGALFARELARRGYHLVLVARRVQLLEALAAEIQAQHPVQVELHQVDLSKEEEIARLEARLSQIQNLEFLINNAGFGTRGRFAKLEPGKPIAMVNVHLMATFRLSRAALPGMLSRRKGAIVNVSSMAAFAPLPGGVVYSATKAALVAFSQALAYELEGSGVQVQVLCPGFLYTEFHTTPEFEKIGRRGIPRFMLENPESVITASFRALEKGQVVCIPGALYKFLSIFTRNQIFLPFVQMFVKWLSKRRNRR